MTTHCYGNDYSEQYMNDAVEEGKYMEVSSGCWKELRMTQSSLVGVFPIKATHDGRSFVCTGVKRYEQSNLVMIEFRMSLHGNINWTAAKDKFQDFLHRKLEIDRSSVIIVGIVSNSDTWYIMKGTPALLEALNKMVKTSADKERGTSILDQVGGKWGVAFLGGIVLLGFIMSR